MQEARKYYEAGRQAYRAGQFIPAIAAFEQAIELSPRVSVKYSLAMAYRSQYFIDKEPARVRRAAALFREVIGEVAKGELREKAAAFLAELEPVVMRLGKELGEAGEGGKAAVTQLMVSSRTAGATAAN